MSAHTRTLAAPSSIMLSMKTAYTACFPNETNEWEGKMLCRGEHKRETERWKKTAHIFMILCCACSARVPFTSAENHIKHRVIKANKLRKYYNVMRDFCMLFHHKSWRLYVVVYCFLPSNSYSLHISDLLQKKKMPSFRCRRRLFRCSARESQATDGEKSLNFFSSSFFRREKFVFICLSTSFI